jgi:hypothetical protein
MAAKVIVGNLPSDTTDAEVKALFEEWGAEAQVQMERDEQSTEKSVSAVVTLDLKPETARRLVEQAKSVIFKGRALTFYAPLFMK